MRTAIYPGTFDPITNGHFDIIQRAVALFDRLIVAVADNPQKTPLFSPEERVQLVQKTVADLDAVDVVRLKGLLADFVRETDAVAIVKGLRAVSDFEFEFQMALMNRRLVPSAETIFLMPSEQYTYLNSTIVKGVASLGGDVSPFVPAIVGEQLRRKYTS